MNKIRVLLAGLVLVIGAIFGSAAPASAHFEYYSQGQDYGHVANGYTCSPGADGYCRTYHRLIYTEDHECDGNASGLVIEFGDGVRHKFPDLDGCSGTGRVYNYDTAENKRNVHSAKMCEAANNDAFFDGNFIGCTAWKDVTPLYHESFGA